jgi:hypothetical protein
MKSVLYFLIIILLQFLFFSCKEDGFFNTERILETEQSFYNFNDTINLKLTIKCKKEKEIKISNNLSNIFLGISIIDDTLNIYNGYRKFSNKKIDNNNYNVIKISNNRPYTLKIKCVVKETKDSVFFYVNQLDYNTKFSKKNLSKNSLFRFHCQIIELNPSLLYSNEDYFNIIDIKLE